MLVALLAFTLYIQLHYNQMQLDLEGTPGLVTDLAVTVRPCPKTVHNTQ